MNETPIQAQEPDTLAEDLAAPVRGAEALLLAELPSFTGQRVLCTSLGRAQFATAAALAWPQAQVVCHFLDCYQAEQARQSQPADLTNLQLVCSADFPNGPYDLAVLPFSRSGEAELARDRLQAAVSQLASGGVLYAAVDQPRDRWLAAELQKLGLKPKASVAETGVVYRAVIEQPLRKVRSFACEFAFRDAGRLLWARSRPSVFAHRRLDLGARKILDVLEVEPGDRVLDVGCGCGALAIAAAARQPTAKVHAVDANPRAIECTLAGAARNQLTNLTGELSDIGPKTHHGDYSLVLANPPYYSGFRLAQLFIEIAHQALRPGGRLLLVTQDPHWYEEHAPRWFRQVQAEPARKYAVLRAVK